MENNVQNKPKKNSKLIIVIIIVGCLYYLIPIGLFGYALISDTYKLEYKVLDDGSIAINKSKVIIQSGVEGYYSEEKKAYYIEGKISNNTNKDYNYLDISYYLYNANDEILGQASTYISNLEAGKTWNFKVVYEDIDASEVTRFEFHP